MLRLMLALWLVITPTMSEACQGYLYTYDLGDPGAEPHPDRMYLKYFIGRVIDVKPLPDSKASPDKVLVSFEIIKDYRYDATKDPVQAWTEVSMCWGTPKAGYIAKFGIDERNSRPGELVRSHWYF